jgi:spore photoproduct lyase
MIDYRPELILVQEQAWQDRATQEILGRLPGIEVKTTTEKEFGVCARNTLVLTRYPGKFLKGCQGAGAELCCNYYVVSYAWNCHFDCTYCVLQSYLGSEALTVFTNIEDLMLEVDTTLRQFPDRVFRIGTGELADSLALDYITSYSKKIVPLFSALPNGILELKTKSNRVANLEGLPHGGRTVISWSMNSKQISGTEEPKAATIEERLSAARLCQGWGYKLGFHFDPIVHYQGWEEEYREVIREIFRAVAQENVAWISLGALRFTPHLRETLRRRFSSSRLPYGEFVPGHHGKLRYFRPIREEIYRKMKGFIQEEAPKVFVYLCMESKAVWERSFGSAPCDAAHLCRQMDRLVGCK